MPPVPTPALSARDVALLRLDRASLPGFQPNQVPRTLDIPENLPVKDAGFVEAMYVGVVKSLLPLQHWVELHADRPLKAIDPLVSKILVLGAYQLIYMGRVPPSIAVNQAVEQCRRFNRPAATGFVNAVLRSILRTPPSRLPPVEHGDPELTESFPVDTFGRLAEVLGVEKAWEFSEHANAQPPLTLRLFPGVKAEDLGCKGEVACMPHQQPGMVVVTGAKRADIIRWAESGLAQPQDPTAAHVASLAELQPGLSVLDRCAGVGTKTLQFRTGVGDTGVVHAVDPNPARCEALRAMLSRRGLTNIFVHQAGQLSAIPDLPLTFDRALVDAPCSNSGVLARRPEARYHQAPGILASLERLQADILADTAGRVAEGGLLLYSTCSIWPEENERLVQKFLQHDPRFTLQTELKTLPQGKGEPALYRDGGYVAVLRRNHSG